MRAALNGERIPMMELLVSRGANVNAEWNGDFPIIFAPCETVDPVALEWLLDQGADPNCRKPGRLVTALDYLVGTYIRSPKLGLCIHRVQANQVNDRGGRGPPAWFLFKAPAGRWCIISIVCSGRRS